MKRIFVFCLITIASFTLIACNDDTEETTLDIMVPAGSPSLSQTHFQHERPDIDGAEYDIEIVSGPDPLGAAFGSESHEIIFAPTNVGARLYNTGDVPYIFAGTVTWGNLYLASGQDIENLEDLDGESIVLFGQSATPDIIAQTLLEEVSFEEEPEVSYVESVNTALGELTADPEKIVLLAEPVLSVGQNELDELHVIDLQAEWQSLTGTDGYPQAGIFVHEKVEKDIIESFLREIEASAEEAVNDPETIAGYAAALDYDFPEVVLVNAIPRSNIAFTSAEESRDAMEFYFEQILDFNPELIGGELPDDDFYFTTE